MNEQAGSYLKNILILLFFIGGGTVLYFTVLEDLLQNSEKIAFLAVVVFIVIGVIYSILSGNRTLIEDELVKSLTDTASKIYSLTEGTKDVQSLGKGKDHDLQFEQIRDELLKLRNMLSQVRKADRFKRLDKAEEMANNIASVVEKIDFVRKIEDTEKFYSAFKGNGSIILDAYRIIKDLEHKGNWIRAR